MKPFIRIFLFLLIIITGISSCGKKWKKPTDVQFKYDIDRQWSENNNLKFESGYIVLQDFEFKGKRNQGEEDIYFKKEFPSGKLLSLLPNAGDNELYFEVLQGTYSNIKISFKIDSDTAYSILLNGTYTNSAGVNVPVIFEFHASETFEINAKPKNGVPEINLIEDIPATVKIILNPPYWFSLVTKNMLENASLTEINDIKVILINDEINENIYHLVTERIDEGSEAIFE